MTSSLNITKLTARNTSDPEKSNISDRGMIRRTMMDRIGSSFLKLIVVCIIKMTL